MVFYWAQPFEMVFFPTEHEKTQPNQPKTLDPSGAPYFLGLLNSTTWKRRVLIEKTFSFFFSELVVSRCLDSL